MESSFNLSAQTLDSIKDRKIILFDISVWNALADGKTNEAIVVRNILIDLVEKGLVFCPLTGPMLWELRRQAGCSFYRTTELMERLSLNIAFRRIDDIFESEIRNYLRYLLNDEFEPLMRNDIFGSLLSYVAPGFRIMHKFDLNNPENLDFLNTLSSAVKNITLTTLMGMIGEKSSPSGLEKPPKYQETNIRRRKLAKGDKNKMKRIEQEVVAQRIVVPKVNKIRSMLPIDQQLYRV